MSVTRVKKINIRHALPSTERLFAMLPVGLYCNNRLRTARSGTHVDCWDGRRRKHYTLVQKSEVAVASSAFTFLGKAIYGETFNYNALCSKWEADCIVEGIGRNGFDRDKVLVIELREIKQGCQTEKN